MATTELVLTTQTQDISVYSFTVSPTILLLCSGVFLLTSNLNDHSIDLHMLEVIFRPSRKDVSIRRFLPSKCPHLSNSISQVDNSIDR